MGIALRCFAHEIACLFGLPCFTTMFMARQMERRARQHAAAWAGGWFVRWLLAGRDRQTSIPEVAMSYFLVLLTAVALAGCTTPNSRSSMPKKKQTAEAVDRTILT